MALLRMLRCDNWTLASSLLSKTLARAACQEGVHGFPPYFLQGQTEELRGCLNHDPAVVPEAFCRQISSR